MNKYIIIAIILFFIPFESSAQKQNFTAADSLLKLAAAQNEPSIKADIYLELNKKYIVSGDNKNGLVYAQKALELSEKSNKQLEVGKALNALGNTYRELQDNSKSLENYQKALNIFQQINDKKYQMRALANIGYFYNYNFFNYPKALEYYQKALELENDNEDIEMRAKLFSLIGDLYKNIGNQEKALEYLANSLKIAKRNNLKSLTSNNLSSLGNYYLNMRDSAKTLYCYREGIEIKRELGDEDGIGSDYANLAALYSSFSDYRTALNYHKKSFDIAKKNNSVGLEMLYYKDVGMLIAIAPDSILKTIGINSNHRNQSVIEYELKALHRAEDIGIKDQIKTILEIISVIYEKNGDINNAHEYYKRFITLRDSIEGAKTQSDIARKDMLYEFDKKETIAKAEQEKKDMQERNIRNSMATGLVGAIIFLFVVFRQRNRISKARKRSDELLLNILPEEVAEELKSKGSAEAKLFDEVTVLFTDFVNFTKTSEQLTPKQLVQELNECFTAFDNIIEINGLEKIKTIGDAYLAVCGLPNANTQHAQKVIKAAFDMRDFMIERSKTKSTFGIRIGIHTGSVVAGIVGIKKFAYDIWGDTVNTAARMEQNSEAGKVNISEATYQLVKNDFECKHRGKIGAKGKGDVDMYFVETAKTM